jgi:hypothetical protein
MQWRVIKIELTYIIIMTTYKITNIEVDSFIPSVKMVVVDTKEVMIQVEDSNTTFEEREELIGQTMCKVLGLSELDYSVNCTYEMVESDCVHTWEEEE